MAYSDLKPYTRSVEPSLPGSERRYTIEEFKKLEQTIRSLITVIKELQAKVP